MQHQQTVIAAGSTAAGRGNPYTLQNRPDHRRANEVAPKNQNNAAVSIRHVMEDGVLRPRNTPNRGTTRFRSSSVPLAV